MNDEGKEKLDEVRKRLNEWSQSCNSVLLEAQGHVFKVKVQSAEYDRIGGGDRRKIQRFSRQSRKRMLEKLARIDWEQAGFVCFITLTYPDRSGPPSADETERDRRTFLKRIRRRHPAASAIWRREWESRKSGDFQGLRFPHYHFLFFGLPFLHHEKLNGMWCGVLDYPGYVRTQIKGLKSWRQGIYYVSKYMAKRTDLVRIEPLTEDRGRETERGSGSRRASPEATRGRAAAAAAGAQPCSLVNVTYLTAGSEESIGRCWGVFNRKHLPLAEKRVEKVDFGSWVKILKDRAREKWDGVDDRPVSGFTLFVEDSTDWMERAERLEEENDDTEGRWISSVEDIPF